VKRVVVDPKWRFELDEELFEAARDGVEMHLNHPGIPPLTWERWIDRPNWALIPDANDPDLPYYKAEFAVTQFVPDDPELSQIIGKVNLWKKDDKRVAGRSAPHTHPGPFRAHVMKGGYTESRFWLEDSTVLIPRDKTVVADRYQLDGVLHVAEAIHQTGETNELPSDILHEVVEIHEPDRTLTVMVGHQGWDAPWGELDPDTQIWTRSTVAANPNFGAMFLDRNPHWAAK
jgi:hypothetical protein